MPSRTVIFSIFGQIEEVVANRFCQDMKATKIDFNHIPATAAYNDDGQPARFAVVMSRDYLDEFERSIALLRA